MPSPSHETCHEETHRILLFALVAPLNWPASKNSKTLQLRPLLQDKLQSTDFDTRNRHRITEQRRRCCSAHAAAGAQHFASNPYIRKHIRSAAFPAAITCNRLNAPPRICESSNDHTQSKIIERINACHREGGGSYVESADPFCIGLEGEHLEYDLRCKRIAQKLGIFDLRCQLLVFHGHKWV